MITGAVSNTIKKSAKRVGAANNFLRKRAPGGGHRESASKGLCVDPFADQPPLLITDITRYLTKTGFTQSDCQLARTLNRNLVTSIVQAYGKEKQVPWNTYNPSTALATLAYFLAHLPYPLLTRQLQECFLMCIQSTRNSDTANDTAQVRKDVLKLTPDLEAIRRTIEMLPVGHQATLTCLMKLFHKMSTEASNNSQPTDIAKAISHELCFAEESTLGKVRSEEQLKANSLVEAMIKYYPTLFNVKESCSETKDVTVRGIRSMSVGARRQFDEHLRSSVMLLKEDLQRSLVEEERLSKSVDSIPPSRQSLSITPEQREACSGYMDPTLTPGALICKSPITNKEWMMLAGFFAAAFLPFLVTGSWWSVVFLIMVVIIIYMNRPLAEVVEFSTTHQKITARHEGFNAGDHARVYALNELESFSLVEHEKKKGSYQITMHFPSGVRAPMTEGFYFSPNGKAQQQLLRILSAFTGKPSEEEKDE